ncbi:MAG: hypothetical protein ACI4D9_10705 [Lachnospiraceae bacterium]
MSYKDLMGLPHHVSKVHPQMSRKNRAAQFAPFAALTGYEEAVREAERFTDRKIILDEHEKVQIDWKLRVLKKHMNTETFVVWFVPDVIKNGGSYHQTRGIVEKWKDGYIYIHGEKIPINDIVKIGDVMLDNE